MQRTVTSPLKTARQGHTDRIMLKPYAWTHVHVHGIHFFERMHEIEDYETYRKTDRKMGGRNKESQRPDRHRHIPGKFSEYPHTVQYCKALLY